MLGILSGEIFEPIIRRLGTASATYLVTVGVHADVANDVKLGIIAVAGITVDLMFSHLARKARK